LDKKLKGDHHICTTRRFHYALHITLIGPTNRS
jgi:hypothetical protein